MRKYLEPAGLRGAKYAVLYERATSSGLMFRFFYDPGTLLTENIRLMGTAEAHGSFVEFVDAQMLSLARAESGDNDLTFL